MLTLSLALADPGAEASYRKSVKKRQKGDAIDAYRAAVRAVALDPNNTKYWAWLKAVERPALEAAKIELSSLEPEGERLEEAATPTARELRSPPRLKPNPGSQDIDIIDNPRALFQKTTRLYGLDCVFDADYPEGGKPQRLNLTQAAAPLALRALETLTNSFMIVLSPRLLLVAKDTDAKRRDLEPTEVVTIPLPDSYGPQDVTEVANAVRTAYDLAKIGIDSNRRQVVIRDRVTKLEPARALFDQLMGGRAEVYIAVDFVSLDKNSDLQGSVRMQSTIPVVPFGNLGAWKPTVPTDFMQFLTFGAGKSLIGVGLADVQLLASLTKGNSTTYFQTGARASDGQAAMVHFGERYPILSQGYYGNTGATAGQTVYTPPPTVQWEDLGVELKFTPRVHNSEELTLDLEAEFKALSGQVQNDIPILQNRKFKTILRLRFDEVALVAGLITDQISQSWSFPLFNKETQRSHSDVLLVITPHLVRAPQQELTPGRAVWVGSESRLLSPLGQ